jgi:hypothetical protein
MFGGFTVNKNWRKQYNKELLRLFGVLDILSFVRISWLNWIGHVNRMDSKRKVSQSFNNNPQWSGLRGRPNKRWWNCVKRIVRNARLKTGNRWQKHS